MPVNHYFQDGNGIGNTAEKRLYEDLIIEGLKIYGQDVYYLPRTLVNRDLILGEDMLSKFSSALLLEAYMETTEGFAGEQEIINKFGLEIREDTTFMVSKRRFNQAVDEKATLVKEGRPNEGDIIYMPLMNSYFEIQFVEDQEPFFQLGQLPIYKLRVTRWEYSSERIDTGVSTIDSIEDSLSTDTMNFQFSLENETGSIVLESSIGAIDYMINESFTMADQATNDQGQIFETEAGTNTAATTDDILDFSERNPFGEVDEY